MAQASYEVEEITATEPNAFNGLDKTWFITGGASVYMFHKTANTPKVGDILEGSITYDRGQNMKFTRAKTGQYASPAPVTPAQDPRITQQVSLQDFADAKPPLPKPMEKSPVTQQLDRVYKADPDKMKQEYTLAQATNMSIQRQTAVKAAVELIIHGESKDYDTEHLYKCYTDIMILLSEPDWTKFATPMDEKYENELPPVENYEDGPTDEEVAAVDGDGFDNDLDRAMNNAIAKDK
jgi:hypothetical protein